MKPSEQEQHTNSTLQLLSSITRLAAENREASYRTEDNRGQYIKSIRDCIRAAIKSIIPGCPEYQVDLLTTPVHLMLSHDFEVAMEWINKVENLIPTMTG